MAVYGRTYRRYDGELTPPSRRFLILPRYAYGEVFQSRLFVAFFTFCFLSSFIALLLIYLHHNVSALKFMNLPLEKLREVMPIDGKFFHRFLWAQTQLGFLLVLFVGPSLVAPDLRNNGLALYLARPFSRAEYVLGKLTVLVGFLSLVTWIPGLVLFGFQASLAGWSWTIQNLSIAWAIFAGSWVWILYLSLLALTVSAWVKWRPVARGALLVLFFAGRAVAEVLENVMGARWARMFDAIEAILQVFASLFGIQRDSTLSPGLAWVSLLGGIALFLFLLSRRLKAYEVVR